MTAKVHYSVKPQNPSGLWTAMCGGLPPTVALLKTEVTCKLCLRALDKHKRVEAEHYARSKFRLEGEAFPRPMTEYGYSDPTLGETKVLDDAVLDTPEKWAAVRDGTSTVCAQIEADYQARLRQKGHYVRDENGPVFRSVTDALTRFARAYEQGYAVPEVGAAVEAALRAGGFSGGGDGIGKGLQQAWDCALVQKALHPCYQVRDAAWPSRSGCFQIMFSRVVGNVRARKAKNGPPDSKRISRTQRPVDELAQEHEITQDMVWKIAKNGRDTVHSELLKRGLL